MYNSFFALVFVFIGSVSRADVENPNVLPTGDREAFFGNAGVAISGSAGNMFFNPAGLAEIKTNRFSAGGSAYALVRGHIKEGGLETDFSTFISVPSMVASIRRWGEWTVGFGVFVPVTLEGLIEINQYIPSVDGNLKLDSAFQTSEQYIGVSGGRALENGWSVGLSLFAHRYLDKSNDTSFLQPNSGTFYISSHEQSENEVLSILPVIGVQKTFGQKWLLGLRVQVPDVEVLGRSKYNRETLVSNAGVPTTDVVTADYDAHYRQPLDLAGGVKFEEERFLFTFNLGFQFPTHFDSTPGSPQNQRYDTKATFRQHFGYEYRFDKEYAIMGGLNRTPNTTGGLVDNSTGLRGRESHAYSSTIGMYSREEKSTSGIGLFYLILQQREELFSFSRDKTNGMQVFGVMLSTSLDF